MKEQMGGGERGRERAEGGPWRGRAGVKGWPAHRVPPPSRPRIVGCPTPNGQVSRAAPPSGRRGQRLGRRARGCERPRKSAGAAQLPQQPFWASQQLLRRGSRVPPPQRAELGCRPRLLDASSLPPSFDCPSYLLQSLPVLCPGAAFVPRRAFAEAAWLPHVTRARLLCPLCGLDPSRSAPSAPSYAGFVQRNPRQGPWQSLPRERRRGIPVSPPTPRHTPRVPAPPSSLHFNLSQVGLKKQVQVNLSQRS